MTNDKTIAAAIEKMAESCSAQLKDALLGIVKIGAQREKFERELDELIASRTPEDAAASRNLSHLRGIPTLTDDPGLTKEALSRLQALPKDVREEFWVASLLPKFIGMGEFSQAAWADGTPIRFSGDVISCKELRNTWARLDGEIEIEGLIVLNCRSMGGDSEAGHSGISRRFLAISPVFSDSHPQFASAEHWCFMTQKDAPTN